MQLLHAVVPVLVLMFLGALPLDVSAKGSVVDTHFSRTRVGVAQYLNSTEVADRALPYICPNGTGYVFDTRSVLRPLVGCAPLGHRACLHTGVPAIAGSCPDGEECCFSGGGERFLGCTAHPDQCCFDTVCPLGTTCCGTPKRWRCCPLLPGEDVPAANFTGYCDAASGTSCNKSLVGPVTCPVTPNATACTSRGFAPSCLNDTNVQCRTSADCVYGSDTLIPWLMNITTGLPTVYASRLPDAPVTCCPPGATVCIDRSRSVVGCAVPARNETCCDHTICPDGYKCCEYTTPLDFKSVDTPVLFNIRMQARCCPIASDCCVRERDPVTGSVGVLLANSTNPSPSKVFCGIPAVIRDNATNAINNVFQCSMSVSEAPVLSVLAELFLDDTT